MRAYILIVVAILSLTVLTAAQAKQRIELQTGETKGVLGSKLNIKFLGIVEDSRCPKGTTCIWAGNAKVSIRVWKKNQKPVDLELNSTLDPRAVEFSGYQITLTGLSPKTDGGDIGTKTKGKDLPPSTAVFEVAKLKG